jgi:hypothetical protein
MSRGDVVGRQLGGGELEVLDQGGAAGRRIGAGGRYAGHGVQPLNAQRGGVGKRFGNAGAELVFAAGNAGDAALAGGPVAGGHVVDDVFQMVVAQFPGHHLRLVIVREEVLDGLKPGFAGGRKTVEEWHLIEHHGQIRCKFRHPYALAFVLAGCPTDRHGAPIPYITWCGGAGARHGVLNRIGGFRN